MPNQKANHCWSYFLIALVLNLTASLAHAQATNQDELSKSLTAVVTKQAADWNNGDIEGYMKGYWNSEDLTFSSGGKTERGWKATRERYLKGYPDREAMGKLSFSELEVFPLNDSAALMLGRWKLERKDPIGGNFSLVWRKIDGTWLIVHDHTSSDRPPSPKKE